MKPVKVSDNTYIDFPKEVNNKDHKFKVGDHVRISKYKNIFAKRYPPNLSEDVFVIKKIKNTIAWTYASSDLHSAKTVGTFHQKELQEKIQEEIE